MPLEYDETRFKEAQEIGAQLKSANSKRNEIMDAMEEMYTMEWKDEDKVKAGQESTAVTRSPGPANKLDGATWLLSATDPHWSLPRETNKKDVDKASSNIERYIARVFECASRAGSEKISNNVARSVLMYGMVVIAVDRASDIVEHLKKRKSGADPWADAAILRAETIAKRAPFLFGVWKPQTCYPLFDRLGLQAFYREVTTTVGSVRDEFGDVEGLGMTRTDSVTLCHYWDYVYRYTWLWGSGTPILAEAHGLPFIPIVVQLGTGSMALFDKPEQWIRPFLYKVWRSNQWSNENLYKTISATSTLAFGSNPMYTAVLQTLDRQLDIDHSVPGGVVKLQQGESFGPTPKMVIDQSVLLGLQQSKEDIDESTIYSQTLGQPLGANATYSMVALLSQAGRLPLATPQDVSGRALAQAGKIVLMWTKFDGKSSKAGYAGYEVEISPADIPDNFELDCKMDVSLPQDKLGNVNVARIATDPNNQLTSVAYAQTNYLGIEQPDEMQKEIMAENVARTFWQQYLQQMIQQQQQMQAQQAQMQQQPQGQPPMQPQGMMPGQGVPPEVMAGGMQGPQPMPGEQQQLPPEMMGGEYAPNSA